MEKKELYVKEALEYFQKLNTKGWDSYDANLITSETVEKFIKLIYMIPDCYLPDKPMASMGPCPDGSIDLYLNDEQSPDDKPQFLVMNVSPKTSLVTVAGMIEGMKDLNDTGFDFSQGIPEQIKIYLEEYFKIKNEQ